MIKIIQHGKNKFKMICSKCGCIFEYELGDLKVGVPEYVNCPECDCRCIHPDQNEENYDDEGFAYIPPTPSYTPSEPASPLPSSPSRAPEAPGEGDKDMSWRRFYVDYKNPPVQWNGTAEPAWKYTPTNTTADTKN